MLFDAISYVDAVLIVVLIIYAIVGFARGLMKQLFTLFGFVAVVAGAILLCSTVADLLQPSLGEMMQNGFHEWMVSKDAGIGNEADKWFTVARDWTNAQNVEIALQKLGLPSLLSGMFKGIVEPTFAEFGTSAVLADVLPQVLSGWAITAIAFVLLFIVFLLLLSIIKLLVFKFIKAAHLGGLDRLLGLVGGAVQAYVIVSVVLTVLLSLLSNVPVLSGVQEFLAEQAQLSASGKFPIFHYLYNNNWIGTWLVTQFA